MTQPSAEPAQDPTQPADQGVPTPDPEGAPPPAQTVDDEGTQEAPVPADEPVSAGVPAPEPTGDEQVDETLAGLGRADGRPLGEHIEAAQQVHRALQQRLSDVHE